VSEDANGAPIQAAAVTLAEVAPQPRAAEAVPLQLCDVDTDPIVLLARAKAAELQNAAACGAIQSLTELCHSPRVGMYIDQGCGDAATTALMCAAQAGRVDAARILLDARAEIDARDAHGRSALMFAAANGEVRATTWLAERGADLALRANNGWTALMFAAACGHHETAGALLEAARRRRGEAAPVEAIEAALSLARAHGQPTVIELCEALLSAEQPDAEEALLRAQLTWRAGGRTPRYEMATDDPLPATRA